MKGAFEIEPVEEIAKAGVEHNQHQRNLRELMIEELDDVYPGLGKLLFPFMVLVSNMIVDDLLSGVIQTP